MSNDIPEWAKQKACDLANAEDGGRKVWEPSDVGKFGYFALNAFARYIAQHEPGPVDPLLVEAREMAIADLYEDGEPAAAPSDLIREYMEGGEEHWAVRFALRCLRRGMELAKPADDGWIDWGGGGRPVPADTLVEVRFRNGETESDRAGAWVVSWDNDSNPFDIIAYRVVQP